MPVADAKHTFFDMSVSEAARTFGVTRSVIVAACRSGVVGHVRWGRRVQRVTGADVGRVAKLAGRAGAPPTARGRIEQVDTRSIEKC